MTPGRLATFAFFVSFFAAVVSVWNLIGGPASWWFFLGYPIGVAVGLVAWLLLRRFRWVRWNFECLRGRYCANLIADAVTVPGDPVLHMEYVCGRCGTKYHWDSLTRERTIVG